VERMCTSCLEGGGEEAGATGLKDKVCIVHLLVVRFEMDRKRGKSHWTGCGQSVGQGRKDEKRLKWDLRRVRPFTVFQGLLKHQDVNGENGGGEKAQPKPIKKERKKKKRALWRTEADE